ncbi:trafficking protein particle complex subunit 2-like protein isoform X6 [Nycticebus coucang]|uniref:trafficking protein particle complex subunit 2-like protein isoform X6 n=1 Tax=Nycticebus coucang TaxID=9470 RepID=UPI00234DC2CE|nr:trafficking protein particle complex subunit 2-like protein isoform X6 [Nycticebus coucang]
MPGYFFFFFFFFFGWRARAGFELASSGVCGWRLSHLSHRCRATLFLILRLSCFRKARAPRALGSQPQVRSMFPNLLCRYGYVTNSKVKFVMVVDSSNTALRDNEIRSMFRKLHNSYTDVMCNPFYNPGDRIQSRAFDNMVMSMMVQVC